LLTSSEETSLVGRLNSSLPRSMSRSAQTGSSHVDEAAKAVDIAPAPRLISPWRLYTNLQRQHRIQRMRIAQMEDQQYCRLLPKERRGPDPSLLLSLFRTKSLGSFCQCSTSCHWQIGLTTADIQKARTRHISPPSIDAEDALEGVSHRGAAKYLIPRSFIAKSHSGIYYGEIAKSRLLECRADPLEGPRASKQRLKWSLKAVMKTAQQQSRC
jgi:hypothetical protein